MGESGPVHPDSTKVRSMPNLKQAPDWPGKFGGVLRLQSYSSHGKSWSQTLAERLTCEKQNAAAVPINPVDLKEAMRLFVVVQDDEIIVTSETGFRAAYCKRPNHPQLKVRRRTETMIRKC